jgi:hypothetical protein
VLYLLPVMQDPEVQANWVLSLALIPAAVLAPMFIIETGIRPMDGCFPKICR